MTKRYPTYHASAAVPSRALGAIAVPVGLVAVLAHRFGLMSAWDMVVAIFLAALLGGLALGLALVSFQRLWRRGGIGFGQASFGLLYGLIALAPAAALLASPLFLRDAADVSTNPLDPPELVLNELAEDAATDRVLDSALETVDRQFAALQDGRPADIVPRRYRMAPSQIHFAAREVFTRKGWPLVDEILPDLPDMPSRLQGEVRSPVLGLVRDLAVRIQPDPLGALVDLRSASRTGLRDIDGNAARIREFLAAMDEVLLETYGRFEVLDVSLEEEEELPLPETPTLEQGGPAPLPAFKPYLPETDEVPSEGGEPALAGAPQT